MMYPGIKIKGRYSDAVREFYNNMTANLTAFENIKSNLSKIFKDTEFLIKKFKNDSKNGKSSQGLLIYLYTTNSSNPIYYKLNEILRNHYANCNNKTITAEDRHIAPYAAALTATLMHWENIRATTNATYRGINRYIYHPGNSVVLISFTSSSLNINQAKRYGNITFYNITNNGISDKAWQPKMISEFSAAPNEQEALYPPGSIFKITATYLEYEKRKQYTIKLSDYACMVDNQQQRNEFR
ncbi:unnamed protein product [Mytilus coruscus]|uniref:NAD(P)(+)--arginine ADP-ribosyltransferase n=1 Tax=Mytilus coruscus TaxID=42192 RepID=A0A6J7ZWH0_MYTCO|nr:unnamed protein product [Mytilus coruscus]